MKISLKISVKKTKLLEVFTNINTKKRRKMLLLIFLDCFYFNA